jgi:CelD/BcsL family acetyltransferase involved in cellulose biosynthesis
VDGRPNLLRCDPRQRIERQGDRILRNLNPLTDRRWEKFVEKHPCSSVFHTVPWMRALSLTCNYEPVVFTTAAAGDELQEGVLFGYIRSKLTGNRLVSMPYADHCDLLNAESKLDGELHRHLDEMLRAEKLDYIELRPRRALACAPLPGVFHSTYTYRLHVLDLAPETDTLWRNLHKSSTQRKVKRAEREGLIYSGGVSDTLLDDFYQLFVLTRRRHRILPQPKRWFRNLIDCFGGSLKIYVAAAGGRPIASILTLSHKDTVVFKYGCSDKRYSALGGVHLLFWRAIQDAKRAGLRQFDFGRTNVHNAGLVTFKSRWGAAVSDLTYLMLSHTNRSFSILDSPGESWRMRSLRRLASFAPDSLFRAAGAVLFRHLG